MIKYTHFLRYFSNRVWELFINVFLPFILKLLFHYPSIMQKSWNMNSCESSTIPNLNNHGYTQITPLQSPTPHLLKLHLCYDSTTPAWQNRMHLFPRSSSVTDMLNSHKFHDKNKHKISNKKNRNVKCNCWDKIHLSVIYLKARIAAKRRFPWHFNTLLLVSWYLIENC